MNLAKVETMILSMRCFLYMKNVISPLLMKKLKKLKGVPDIRCFLYSKYNILRTLSTLGPPSVTKRTMTGFSDPATKPNPRAGFRSRVTVRGSGSGSCSWHRDTGISYVVVLFTWLKNKTIILVRYLAKIFVFISTRDCGLRQWCGVDM